jgi:hypothetical protein
MFDQQLSNALSPYADDSSEPVLRKVYYFHDIRITCQANHPTILTILDGMLGRFPEPEPGAVRGEALYAVSCHASASLFPVRLPHARKRSETLRLLTNTRLKYYHNQDGTVEYQFYEALPSINAPALSVICASQHIALTQLEPLEHYQAMFLRRYVLLIALGQLVRPYGFEPCHTAAITSPWDDRQGALIIGNSGSGKTTLSLGCTISGCGLLGDDIIMLREEEEEKKNEEDKQDKKAGQVVKAYSISQEVSVRPGSLDLWPSLSFLQTYPADAREKRYCSIEQIRSGATSIATPIHLLIFPSFTTGTHSTLTSLSKAMTLQALIEHCTSAGNSYPQAQDRLFSLLSALAEQARGYQLAVAWGNNDGPELVCSLFKGDQR